MPKFHSLLPVSPPRFNEEPRELVSTSRPTVIENAQERFHQEMEFTPAPVTPVPSGEQYSQAEPISPANPVPFTQPRITTPREQALSAQYRALPVKTEKTTQPLQSAQAVQRYQPKSLLTALQSTMEPKTNRLPVVIPAEMKRRKLQPVKQTISPAARRTISRFKLGIVLGAMLAFLFLTAFSFGPTSQGKYTIPLLGDLIQQSQGQGPNSALSQAVSPQQNTQPVAPAMPNIPQTNLVALAQQDAIQYGISPVYFVRQINAESGFNPNAYSPAGAVGIAQFEPATAAALGINPYDPVSALNGAAKYMAGLSNQFGGDYAKALAAYNAGSGAVNNAVASAGANWLSLMPYETQVYVMKIMG